MPFISWVSNAEVCGLHDPFRIFTVHSQHLEGEHLERLEQNMGNSTVGAFLPCTPKMWANFITSSQEKESPIASGGTSYPLMREAFNFVAKISHKAFLRQQPFLSMLS